MKRNKKHTSKKVTIYDVSREAGVSLATVSRVINGSNVVKPKTRDRVMEVIKRLDFKPNEIARGLATSKTTTIAVVFPQSLFSHVKDMIGGIGDTSRHLDYNVVIYTTDDIGDGKSHNDIIEKVVKSRADGVVLFNDEFLDQQIEQFNHYGIPVVVIGRCVDKENIGSVFVDAEKLAFDLIDDYLDQGIDDIIFVNPKQNIINHDKLEEGIRKAYEKHKKVLRDDQIIETSMHYENTYPFFKDYFKTHRHQLVFAGYDKEGVAVINAALDNGIRIPEEMEVIGLLNTSYSIMCKPTLSSIHVPVYDMGAMAIRLLTKILQKDDIESYQVTVPYQFFARESIKH